MPFIIDLNGISSEPLRGFVHYEKDPLIRELSDFLTLKQTGVNANTFQLLEAIEKDPNINLGDLNLEDQKALERIEKQISQIKTKKAKKGN